MATTASPPVPPIIISLLGDKTSGQVLYMEAGKDFMDLLFSLILLPASTTFGLLFENGTVREGQDALPGIMNLYGSISKLQDQYLLEKKEDLMSPKLPINTASQTMFRLTNSSTVNSPQKYYRCSFGGNYASNSPYVCTNKVSTNYNARCKDCNSGNMTVEVTFVDDSGPVADVNAAGGGMKGFVKETVTFMITDNLEMFPASTIKSVSLLNRVKVCSFEDLESIEVEIDAKKALEIVRSAYLSKTVLNDVFGKLFKAKVSTVGKFN